VAVEEDLLTGLGIHDGQVTARQAGG
jgi:hypothetical protein